jgi:formate-nitrite transporter family protein
VTRSETETKPEDAELLTERAKERAKEDAQFVPVVVKRTDEAKRHPDDMLEQAVKDGLEQTQRRAGSLVLSSVAAGLIIGFTAVPVGVVTTSSPSSLALAACTIRWSARSR